METKSWGLLMLIINIFFPGIGSIIAGLKGASSRCAAACCVAPLPRRRPRTLTGPLRHHPPLLRARLPLAAHGPVRVRASAWLCVCACARGPSLTRGANTAFGGAG